MKKKKNIWERLPLFLAVGITCLVVLLGVVFLNLENLILEENPTTISREELGIATVQVPVSQGIPRPTISARNALVLDRSSKTVMFQINADERVLPASTTKIMTALVVLENFTDLDQEITIPQAFPIGSNIGLEEGEKLTVEQLLYAMLVQSANDAAEVLAATFPGGRRTFVNSMNQAAVKYHLGNTQFRNPTGIDEEGHYSSAADLARLADVALRKSEFAKIVTVENAVVSDHVISNINQLLGRVAGVKGIKTGFTEGAGQALVSLVEREGHEILVVVLGSTDRFKDSEDIIEWVYANFVWQDVTAGS